MELTNEREAKYTLFDIEKLSEKDAAKLRKYGLEKIKDDPDALINYAVNRLLLEYIQKKENDIESMVDMLPKGKAAKYRKAMDKIRKEKA